MTVLIEGTQQRPAALLSEEGYTRRVLEGTQRRETEHRRSPVGQLRPRRKGA